MMSKNWVVLLNMIMLVVGAIIVTLGLYGMNVGSQVSHLVSTMAPTYTMLLGLVLVLVSLWGIYAAVNEDPLLLQIVIILIKPTRLNILLLYSTWD